MFTPLSPHSAPVRAQVDDFSRIFEALWQAVASHRRATPPSLATPALPGPPAAAAPGAEAAERLSGRLVTLRGLSGRAELNGRRARCLRYDPNKGRCSVRLVDSREMLSIKPANLEPSSDEMLSVKPANLEPSSEGAPPPTPPTLEASSHQGAALDDAELVMF